MSDLHLKTGDEKPPLVQGKLRLYSMKFCPYAERVRLVLLDKNIPHDVVNINLRTKPEWIFEMNPKGCVPILDIGSKIISESVDICKYLYKEHPPFNKKSNHEEDEDIITNFDKLIKLYYASIREHEKTMDEYISDMMVHLNELEAVLSKRGCFFEGSKPGIVDFMIWPWAERAEVLEHSFEKKLSVTEKDLPLIFNWCKTMRSLDCVKKTITSPERLYKASFHQKFQLDYDAI